MVDKDPLSWEQTTWVLLFSAAILAYIARLLDKIQNKRLKSFIIEILEFIICVGIAFGVYLTSSFFALDERLVWLCSVYLSHKGTRYIFTRLDLAAERYFTKIKGGSNGKNSNPGNS